MNTNKFLILLLSLSLITAISALPVLSITKQESKEATSWNDLMVVDRGIPGITSNWWKAVEDQFHPDADKIAIDLLNTSPNWTDRGKQPSAYFGYSVASAGDVNGDGYADVIVGAHGYDGGHTEEGRAFVYYGSMSGLTTTPDVILEINSSTAEFGWSVGTAGDVNGDGYADVIVGARRYTNGETYEGGAFVFHGSEQGLSTTQNWSAEGDEEHAWFGYAVGTAGDVNKDGYDDVIVGQCHYDSSTLYESEVYVFHGSETGLSATADWMEDMSQADAYFGCSVGTAGDVNGDTYADVIIGAPWYHDGQTDEGAAFVYHGSMTVLPSDPDWTVESNREGAYFGFSVGTAGNVNGDVYSDVIVGAPYDSNEQSTEGRVYAFHGSAAGLSASANWIAEIDQADAHFGISVATAGDVNDDGYSDVIIGADYYTNDRNREGAAYVYTGSGTGLSNTPGWTTEGNSSFAYYGFSVGTAGDVNGNDYSDVIVGAYGFEYDYSFEGKAYIYHDSVGVWFQNFLPLLRK